MPSTSHALIVGVLTMAMLIGSSVRAQPARPVLVGIDAEFGHVSSTSAEAIRRGATVAIEEINRAGGVLGRQMAIEIRDNRSIPRRAVENFEDLAANPDVVAVLTGKFSPAVMEVLPIANRLGLPLLAAWSAADGITAHGQRPDYVFRLSLRDEWALDAMIRHAIRGGARKLGLLVPNTTWGRSCVAATEKHVRTAPGAQLVGVNWYNFGDRTLLPGYQQLRQAGAQTLLLVANEGEGAMLVNEMGQLPVDERMPVVSHWGVTGGRFFELASASLAVIDFSVVQTHSFIDAKDPVAQRVLAGLRQHFDIRSARQIDSPAGVAHAYDLVHLLARAIVLAGTVDRSKVRDALERVRNYQGVVRNYREPFTPDRHEALDRSVVFLARYGKDGALLRTGRKP